MSILFFLIKSDYSELQAIILDYRAIAHYF